MSLGVNDLEPCGTPTAVRRHTALAEGCPACEVEGRPVRRPSLADIIARKRVARVALAGDRVFGRSS